MVSRCSSKSEYHTLANAATDLLWLQSLHNVIGVLVTKPSQIWCDNLSTISLVANSVFHTQIKHIDIDIHFIRDLVQIIHYQLDICHMMSN